MEATTMTNSIRIIAVLAISTLAVFALSSQRTHSRAQLCSNLSPQSLDAESQINIQNTISKDSIPTSGNLDLEGITGIVWLDTESLFVSTQDKVIVWNINDNTMLDVADFDQAPYVQMSFDGKRLLTVKDDRINVYDIPKVAQNYSNIYTD